MFTHGTDTFAGMSEPRRLVVFDFGGGTCDVALFERRIRVSATARRLAVDHHTVDKALR